MLKVKVLISFSILLLALGLIACNLWVILSTKEQVYTDVAKTPHRAVALVLGTSNRLSDGRPNPFFTNRIETTYQLYKKGKVDYIIVSGDNRSKYYNEPMAMRKALLEKGIPAEIITLDYAGLRTLDSIIRCKKIFGQNSITIITQSFHSYRALFISQYYQLDAIVVVADENSTWQSTKVVMREFLARPLAILDLYVLKTTPRFLGDKEELNGI